MTEPMIPIRKIPIKTLSERDICCANTIVYPRPDAAANISAPISARQAYPRPMRIPVRISNRDEGSRIRKNCLMPESPRLWPTSSSPLSHRTNPDAMFISIGKNEASTIMISFGSSPSPNHRIKREISASGGTFLKKFPRYRKYPANPGA